MSTRPMTASGSRATTPCAAAMIDLLGGAPSPAGHAMTRDEYRAAARLYGFVPELPRERPPEPAPTSVPDTYINGPVWVRYRAALTAWQIWKDPREFAQAGADLSIGRHMMADGLRIVAWLGKYMQPGQDPMRMVIQMAAASGWDVDPEDYEWSEGAEP